MVNSHIVTTGQTRYITFMKLDIILDLKCHFKCRLIRGEARRGDPSLGRTFAPALPPRGFDQIFEATRIWGEPKTKIYFLFLSGVRTARFSPRGSRQKRKAALSRNVAPSAAYLSTFAKVAPQRCQSLNKQYPVK